MEPVTPRSIFVLSNSRSRATPNDICITKCESIIFYNTNLGEAVILHVNTAQNMCNGQITTVNYRCWYRVFPVSVFVFVVYNKHVCNTELNTQSFKLPFPWILSNLINGWKIGKHFFIRVPHDEQVIEPLIVNFQWNRSIKPTAGTFSKCCTET